LVANTLDVQLELLLDSPQFHLELPHQIFQLARLYLPSSALLDFGLYLSLVISSQSGVLLAQPLRLSGEHIDPVFIHSHHFPEIPLVLFRCLYLQSFVFAHQALDLLLQPSSYQQSFSNPLSLRTALQLRRGELLNEPFSILEGALQSSNLVAKGFRLYLSCTVDAFQTLLYESFCLFPLVSASLAGLLSQFRQLNLELLSHLLPQLADLPVVGLLQLTNKDIFAGVPLIPLLLELGAELVDDASVLRLFLH